MIKEGKFGPTEAICLITVGIASKALFTSPGYITRIVGTAGWYMTLISAAMAAICFAFVCSLLKRFPGKNIVEIFDISLGRIVGFIFSGFFTIIFTYGAAMLVREYAEVLKVYALPLTPISIVTGSFIIGVITMSYLGIENIARFTKLAVPGLLLAYVGVIVLAWEDYDFRWLFPILGHGIGATVKHGLFRSSAYGEVMTLTVFSGSLQGIKHIKKIGYISLIFSGLIISSLFVAVMATFSAYIAQESTSAVYEMVKLIDYGKFFQRLDPIFLFLWSIATLITITTLFYSGASVYCKMFRIQNIKPTLIPFAIILFTIAMVPNDISVTTTKYTNILREYGWIIFFGLPIITLVVAMIRKKGAMVSGA